MKLFRKQRQPEPEPPRNVRLCYADGTTVPVECVYDGLDEQCLHVWRMVLPESVLLAELVSGRILIEVLPARTVVRLPVT